MARHKNIENENMISDLTDDVLIHMFHQETITVADKVSHFFFITLNMSSQTHTSTAEFGLPDIFCGCC